MSPKGWPKRVVDVLEVVKVEQHKARAVLLSAVRLGERTRQIKLQLRAISQPGELVVRGVVGVASCRRGKPVGGYNWRR